MPREPSPLPLSLSLIYHSLSLSLSLSLLSSTKVYPELFVGCNVIELDWVSTDLSFLPKTHREHKIHFYLCRESNATL